MTAPVCVESQTAVHRRCLAEWSVQFCETWLYERWTQLLNFACDDCRARVYAVVEEFLYLKTENHNET